MREGMIEGIGATEVVKTEEGIGVKAVVRTVEVGVRQTGMLEETGLAMAKPERRIIQEI